MWPHHVPENLGNEHPTIPQGRRLPEGNVLELVREVLKNQIRFETKFHLAMEQLGIDLSRKPEKPVEQP